jgi:hypothetical protein
MLQRLKRIISIWCQKFCNLVDVVKCTTGFSSRRDVGYFLQFLKTNLDINNQILQNDHKQYFLQGDKPIYLNNMLLGRCGCNKAT